MNNRHYPFALSLPKGFIALFERRNGLRQAQPKRKLSWLPIPLLALALAACGSRTALTPPEGKSLPPKPLAAQETPTPEELMTSSPQSRPGRSDELLKQSKKREQDEFDLPPPG